MAQIVAFDSMQILKQLPKNSAEILDYNSC